MPQIAQPAFGSDELGTSQPPCLSLYRGGKVILSPQA